MGGDANIRTQAPGTLPTELHDLIAQDLKAAHAKVTDVAQMTLRSLPLHTLSTLEASRLIKAKGGFVRCLGEAAHLAGGRKNHLLICELSLFDLKINRSKLVRPMEAFPCHALRAVALELAVVLQHCDSLQDGPRGAPEEKQAADGVIILSAPNRWFFANSSPWSDFNISSPLFAGQLPQS